MASAEEVVHEATAKFKVWEAGILEKEQLVLLERLKEIVENRLGGRLDAVCADQVGRLPDHLDRKQMKFRERSYSPG